MRGWGLALSLTIGGAAACAAERATPEPSPSYDADIAPLLAARCVACHGGAEPAAGWSATSFLGAIGCVAPSASPATLPADARAPILAALDVPPHVGLVTAAERGVLARWVTAATPAAGLVHDPGFTNPRSAAFHGASLRATRWRPMLDASDPNACGRCHDGVASRPDGVVVAAPGAPACTSCHDRPGGVLACGTCHGSGDTGAPPRDPCFFPADVATAGAHAVHVLPSAAAPAGLACATCHPSPGPAVIGGLHGDGSVEIVFDPARVAPEASYDRTTGRCAVSCHDRGGAAARPAWSDTAAPSCGGCHGAPPARHYPGACNRCHAEVNAAGTTLSNGPLHMNGRVDLGDGTGGCGACHGDGASAWPSTGAHAAHRTPALTAPIDCASCHPVPADVHAGTHLDGVVQVAFSGRSLARGVVPTWDGARCADVACHGAGLGAAPPAPAWTDTSGAPAACGGCHGVPPENHTPSTSCNRGDCHGAEVAIDALGVPSISVSGRALHIDGIVESAR